MFRFSESVCCTRPRGRSGVPCRRPPRLPPGHGPPRASRLPGQGTDVGGKTLPKRAPEPDAILPGDQARAPEPPVSRRELRGGWFPRFTFSRGGGEGGGMGGALILSHAAQRDKGLQKPPPPPAQA
jgi:hypothetical protein